MSLDNIIFDVIRDFEDKKTTRIPITKQAIPILYFGDQNAYQDSEIKIITVGLNPSHHEFPKHKRFSRFKKAERLDTSTNWSKSEYELYLESLNYYFKEHPYNWFGSYEPILNGMNSSYYPDEHRNRVLHTDLCSSYATDITWSKLRENYRSILMRAGVKIWHRLVDYLQPDIILVSIASDYLRKIRYRKSKWKEHTTFHYKKDGTPRSYPEVIKSAKALIGDKNSILVHGRAYQKPFGSLSNTHKILLGERIADLL